MNAPFRKDKLVRGSIETHFNLLHSLAKNSGVDGKLVLFTVAENPKVGKRVTRPYHFKIGNISEMTDMAIALSESPHLNVYASWAVFKNSLPLEDAGGEADVEAVLAFVR